MKKILSVRPVYAVGALVSALLLGGILGCAIPKGTAPNEGQHNSYSNQEPTATPFDNPVSKTESSVIGENTAVFMLHSFSGCEHTVSLQLKEDLCGKSASELKELFDGITEITVSDDQWTLLVPHDVPCPNHYMLIAGAEALYVLKTDENTYESVCVTTIGLEDMSEDTLLELEKGVLFNSLSEIDAYIEGQES